jgi:hypothetical protein
MALIFLNRVRTCILSQLNGNDRRGLCSLDQGRCIRSDPEIGLQGLILSGAQSGVGGRPVFICRWHALGSDCCHAINLKTVHFYTGIVLYLCSRRFDGAEIQSAANVMLGYR